LEVRAHGQNDHQVSYDGDQIHEKEHVEEEGMQFKIFCQSQKKEF
jgi:hypothetical protein